MSAPLKHLKNLAWGLLLMGAAAPAHAGLYLEGYGGAGGLYSAKGPISEIPFEEKEAEKEAEESKGAEAPLLTQYSGGGRLGWSQLGLALGLDLSASLLKEKNGRSWMILPGAFISYKLPLFFRIYGALAPYGFLLGGANGGHLQALALKAGISLLSLPFVSLNAECQIARAIGPLQNADFYSLSAHLSVSL